MAQSFHAGGAATHRLLDPSIHGLGLLRTMVSRWSELDLTQVGSIIAIAGLFPTAWKFLGHAWHESCVWVRKFFIASVAIPPADPMNRTVVNWVLDHVIEPQNIRFVTARTKSGRSADRAATLKKTKRVVQYCPHWETTWFCHSGTIFIISRSLAEFNSAMSDPTYDGIGGESLTVSCLGRSILPIKALIETCREYSDFQTQYFVMIYSRDRYGVSPKSRKPIRPMETVHFDEQLKHELLTDIKLYLDPRSARRYQQRSMPYRRGYLFYGPPGTGKSSLSTALAGEFGLDLYELNIPSIASDADLEQMFQEVPPQCIVLLEDVDAVWTGRDLEQDDSSRGSTVSNCTLSGLLNVLDGVGSQEGRIVIMTTNKPDRLDEALVRPGRIDMKIFLGNISQNSARQMFVRMFAPELQHSIHESDSTNEATSQLSINQIEELATRFASKIPENTLTPSQLQGFFQLHLDNAIEAVASISPWIQGEASTKPDKDFELVDEQKD